MYRRIPTVSISNTVDRTIAHKVISDLKNNLSIESKAFIALENIFTQNTFKSGVNMSIDKNQIDVPIAESITAKIDSRKANEMSVGNILNESSEIFRNKHLLISTEFINTEMTVTINYNTKSKVNAEELVNMLRDHNITRGAGFMHSVDYYYIIPEDLLGIMEEIFSVGKINYDDGKDFLDYLKDGNKYDVVTLRSDINGVSGNVGLTALGSGVIHGLFEIDTKNTEKDYDQGLNMWTVAMTYKFNYMAPESFIVDHAILVNNSMVDDEYIQEATINPSQYDIKYDLYPMKTTPIRRELDCVHIPPYDNHVGKLNKSTSISPILSVLCMIEPNDLTSLLNLKELIYYELSDDIIEYMELNPIGLVSPFNRGYDSLFMLDLYKDNILVNRNSLTIDNELNVSAKEDLEITSTYRVVLSVLTNSNLLKEAKRSPTDNELLKKMITKIESVDPRLADVSDRNLIPVSDFRRITSQVSVVNTFFKEGVM